MSAPSKHVPKDAQVIMSILKELNVREYDPRVVNQLLEFTYRYVTCILDDAKVFANHARKKTIDLEDVRMASNHVLDTSFTNPPPRHVIAKIAEKRNAMPLPAIRPHCGLRLPPDRYCLIGTNYKLRAANQPKKMIKSAFDSRANIKTQIKSGGAGTGGGGGGGSVARRQNANPPKQNIVTISKPIIKFTAAKPAPPPLDVKVNLIPTTIAAANVGAGAGAGASVGAVANVMDIKTDILETDMDAATNATAVGSISVGGSGGGGGGASGGGGGVGGGGGGVKREREEDEFEIVQ